MNSNHKTLRRKRDSVLALILSIAMVWTMIPGLFFANTAYAAAGDVPAHAKTRGSNGDGTYKLELSVTGDADTDKPVANVNVLIVYDNSYSMVQYRASGNSGPYRADAAEKVVYDFLGDLQGHQDTANPNNIQVALVTFAANARIAQNWTSDINGLRSNFSATGNNGSRRFTYGNGGSGVRQGNGWYTNWQAAVTQALTVVRNADNDNTFVVYITDGAPTIREGSGYDANDSLNHYRAARTNVRAVQTTIEGKGDGKGTFYGIYAYGREADYLDDLVYYAHNGAERAVVNGNTQPTDYYYNASSTEELESAIAEIFNTVAETLGITEVEIKDGTTNDVTTTTGDIAHLLEIDETSYQYWLSIPIVNNTFTRVDRQSGETVTYNVRSNGNGTVTVTWGTNSVTVNGSVTGGTFKYEWTEANALYNFAPPKAKLNGTSVDWDLNAVGTLLDGVTYSVTFDVYPSQETYDMIADLDNAADKTAAYNALDANIRKYLLYDEASGSFSLETNTGATLTYNDTRTDDGKKTVDFNDLPAVPTVAEQMDVQKIWVGTYKQEQNQPLEMEVMRDGVKMSETIHLDTANNYRNSMYIATGLLRVNKETGKVQVLDKGHDYQLVEPENLSYHWELDAAVMHPMIINGELHMLTEAEDHPDFAEGVDYVSSGGKEYFRLNTGTAASPKYEYFVVETSTNALTATNTRRANLNLTKAVTGNDAPEDAVFTFDVTIDNLEDKVWFSISEDAQGQTLVMDDGYVEGAEKEIDKDGQFTGYYYTDNKSKFTVKLKDGWNMRMTNVLTGTTYEITETGMDTGFSFDSAAQTPEDEENFSVEGQTAKGTVIEGNTDYIVTYTNEYKPYSFTPQVTKKVTGRDAFEAFRFSLTPDEATQTAIEEGKLSMGTAEVTTSSASMADGTSETLDFGKIYFYQEGTYTFKVKEETTTDVQGWTYDNEEKTISVVVTTDSETGLLTGEVTGNNPQIINNFTMIPDTAQIPIRKVLSYPEGAVNVPDITGKYTFTLTADNAENEEGVVSPMPKSDTVKVNPDDDGGDMLFGEIEYTEPGTYHYIVTETNTNGEQVEGVVNGNTVLKTSVTVTLGEDGHLVAVPASTPESPLTFTNTYREVSATINVSKVLDSNGYTAPDIEGKYKFTLAAVTEGAPMPDNTEVINTAGNELKFGPIYFDKTGTYEYTVTESNVGDPVPGVFNDSETVKHVTITVSEKEATVTVTDEAPADESEEAAPASRKANDDADAADEADSESTETETVMEKKIITETVMVKKEVLDDEGNPVLDDEGNPVIEEVPEEVEKEIEVPVEVPKHDAAEEAEAEAAKEPAEESTEAAEAPALKAAGDEEAADPDNPPELEVTVNPEQVIFTNIYRETTAEIPVLKILEGEGADGLDITGLYTFTLAAGSNTAGVDTPMPTTTSYTNPAADGGRMVFGSMKYLVPGTYTYTVTESRTPDAAQIEGITDDSQATKTVTVTVEYNAETKELTATVTPSGDTEFTNTYEPQTVTVEGKKEFADGSYKDLGVTSILVELTGKVKDAADAVVTKTMEVAVAADGTANYKFENLPKFLADGVTLIEYTLKEISVFVTKDDGTKEDIISYYDNTVDGHNITNEIKTYDVTVKKTFKGITKDLIPKDFAISVEYSKATREPNPEVLTINDEGVEVSADGLEYTWTLKDVPAGAVLDYSESGTAIPGWTLAEDAVTEGTLEITPDGDHEFALTNPYTRNNYNMKVIKTFSGEGIDEDRLPVDTFEVAVKKGNDALATLKLDDEDVEVSDDKLTYTWTIADVPFEAEITASESGESIDGFTLSSSAVKTGDVTIGTDEDANVIELSNPYTRNSYDMTVIKTFSGEGIDESKLPVDAFEVAVKNGEEDLATLKLDDAEGLEVSDDGLTYTWTIADVPFEAEITAEESGEEIEGFTLDDDNAVKSGSVTIGTDEAENVIELSNPYSRDYTDIKVIKVIENARGNEVEVKPEDIQDATFTITEKPEDYTGDTSVEYSEFTTDAATGEVSYTFTHVPTGDYKIVETGADVDGYELTTSYVPANQTATAVKDETAEITVTNSYRQQFGDDEINKPVFNILKKDQDGDAMSGVEFALTYGDDTVWEGTTDADGKAVVDLDEFDFGSDETVDFDFTLTETAPTGYTGQGPWTVTVGEDGDEVEIKLNEETGVWYHIWNWIIERFTPGPFDEGTKTLTVTNPVNGYEFNVKKTFEGIEGEDLDKVLEKFQIEVVYTDNNAKKAEDGSVPTTTKILKIADATKEGDVYTWNVPNVRYGTAVSVEESGFNAAGYTEATSAEVNDSIADPTITDTSVDFNMPASNEGVVSFTNEYTNTPPEKDVFISGTTTSIDGKVVKPGDILTYQIEYVNNSGEFVEQIDITDTVPEHTKYVDGTAKSTVDGTAGPDGTETDGTITWTFEGDEEEGIAEGTKFVVTFNVEVLDDAGTVIENQAKVIEGENEFDTNITTNSKPHKDVYEQGKTDVSIDGKVVKPGDKLTYQIEYTNVSNELVEQIDITDVVPEHTKYVDGSAKSKVDGAAGPDGTESGGTITWTFTGDAEKGIVKGTKLVATFDVEVLDDAGTVIENQAKVIEGENEYDTNITTNSKPHKDVYEQGKTDVSIDGKVVKPGDILTYQINYTNTSNELVEQIDITDVVPEHTKLVADSAKSTVDGEAGPAGAVAGRTITWTFTGDAEKGIAKGTEFTATFDVEVLDDAGVVIENQAKVIEGENEYDTNITTNSKPHKDVYEQGKTDVSIDGKVVKPGDKLTYQIEYTNVSSELVEQIDITDVVPEHTKYVEGSAKSTVDGKAGPDGTESGGTITWTFTSDSEDGIAKGTKLVATFDVEVLDDAGTVIENQAKVIEGENEYDTNITTNSKPHKDVYEQGKTDVSIDGKTVKAGDVLTYQINYVNTSNDFVEQIDITDQIPEHTKFVAGSAKSTVDGEAGPDGTEADGTITWTFTGDAENGIAKGTEFVATFDVEVLDDAGTVIENQAKVIEGDNEYDTNITTNNKPHKDVFEEGKTDISIDGKAVKAGDVLTYQIEYTNTSKELVEQIDITDVVPEHTKFVAGSAKSTVDGKAGPDGTESGGTITWSFTGDAETGIAQGTKIVVTFNVEVLDDDGTVIENQAKVIEGENEYDTNITTNSKPHKDVFEQGKTDVSIDGNVVKPGDKLTYQIEYVNESDKLVEQIDITDIVPEHTKYVDGSAKSTVDGEEGPEGTESGGTITWTFTGDAENGIAKGTTLVATFDVEVLDDAGTVIENQAKVIEGENEYETNITTNSKPHKDVFEEGKLDVSIDGNVVKPGDVLTYQIKYTNTSKELVEQIDITDVVPEHTEYVDGTAKSTVDGEAGPDGTESGGTITWTFTGDEDTGIAEGTEFVATFNVKVLDDAGTVIENQAKVIEGENEYDTNITTNSKPHKDVYEQGKTDVSIDGKAVKAGDKLTYQINYVNTSKTPVEKIEITDVIPEHTKYVAGSAKSTVNGEAAIDGAEANGTITWTFIAGDDGYKQGDEFVATFDVEVLEDDGTVIENQAKVIEGENEYDTNITTNSKPHKDVFEEGKLDVSIDGKVVKPGDVLTYQIEYVNTSKEVVEQIDITDVVPEHTKFVAGSAKSTVDGKAGPEGTESGGTITWTFTGDEETGIAKGTKIVATFNVEVLEDSGSLIENQAKVIEGENESETNITTNSKPAKDVFKQGQTDVSIDGQLVQAGDKLTYQIKYVNPSKTPVEKIEITDVIPEHTKYVAGSAKSTVNGEAAIDGAEANGTITWTFNGTYRQGDEFIATFDVEVLEDDGIVIENQAKVIEGENEYETNITTNSKPVKDVFEEGKLDVSIDGKVVKPGQVVTYVIEFSNPSDSDADMIVTDVIPSMTEFVSADKGGTLEGGTVKWVVPVKAGETEKVSFNVRVSKEVSGDILENTGKVKLDENSPEVETNTVVNPTPRKLIIEKNLPDFVDHETDLDDGAFNYATFAFEITGTYVDENGETKEYRNTIGMDFSRKSDLTQTVIVENIPREIQNLTVEEVYSGNYDPEKIKPEVKLNEKTGRFEVSFKNTKDNIEYKGGVVNHYDREGFNGSGETASGEVEE